VRTSIYKYEPEVFNAEAAELAEINEKQSLRNRAKIVFKKLAEAFDSQKTP